MNDVADHEARFHDHGEQVGEPYPQMSEDPLRTGVGKLTADNADGTYTMDEQVWDGGDWVDGEAPGQYMGVTVRDINASTGGPVGDDVFFWEQYDQDGAIELVVAVGSVAGADKFVAAEEGQAPDYLLNVMQGDSSWIRVLSAGAKVGLEHIGPDSPLYDPRSFGGGYNPEDICAVCDAMGHIAQYVMQKGTNTTVTTYTYSGGT